jgi:hypothetical protein
MKQQKDLSLREAGLFISAAMQGLGKTRQNMWLISRYVKDKIDIGVRGRKCLILDPNGEYTEASLIENGITDLKVKTIAVKDVAAWCRSNIVECRRIDMKSLIADDRAKILNYIIGVSKNMLLCIEDLNTICLNVLTLDQMVQNIVNLRHKAVDVLTSYQSLRAVEPRMLQNCRHLRLHYQLGSVDDIKSKLPCDKEVFKLAQLIINTRYYAGDKYFFLYIQTLAAKIEGTFDKAEFMDACRKFLLINKKRLKEEMDITGCKQEDAVKNQSELLYKQFYGNPDKEK